MKAIVYKAQDGEWLVIIEPDTDREMVVATCILEHFAVGVCVGCSLDYTVSK